MRRFRSRPLPLSVLAACAVFFLAACGQPTATPLPPPGTFAPQPRDVATQPPPAWSEGSQAITRDNASQITYIGRLDTTGTPSTLFAYAFSPDNTRLVGLNNDLLIEWDLVTGQTKFTTSRSDAQYVYYSADKTEIYTVNTSGTISVFDADTGQAKTTMQGQSSFNNAIAYDADDGWLAMGGQDGTVKVWDVTARQSLVTIQAHKLQVTGIAFSYDGKTIATSSDDQTVKLWDWQNKKTLAAVQATAQKMAFSPDGSQLAVGEDTKITLWNTSDGKLLYTFNVTSGSVSDVLAYSPDGKYLINGGSGTGSMSVWNTQTGLLANALPGVGGDATSGAFSPNGQLLVTSVLGGAVTLWDTSSFGGQTLSQADLPVNTRQILYSDWTGDGFLIVLVDATGPVQVWGIPAPPVTPTTAPTVTPVS